MRHVVISVTVHRHMSQSEDVNHRLYNKTVYQKESKQVKVKINLSDDIFSSNLFEV